MTIEKESDFAESLGSSSQRATRKHLIGGSIGVFVLVMFCVCMAVFCVCVLVFDVLGGTSLWDNFSFVTPKPTRTFELAITNTPSPIKISETLTPSPTQPLFPPTPTLITPPTPIDLGVGEDGMILLFVPAGEFTMGSEDGDDDEKPVHIVYLDAFWIDQTEVTNVMYARCVWAGYCSEPAHTDNYFSARYRNHPVVYVSWDDANTYCSWVNRRLPTESEWEKAARGENALTYPWGNDRPNNNLLNSSESPTHDTTEVGSYPSGASPYGVLDMAGNVWDWVVDWYDVYPNGDPNASFGFGQSSRVLRGGAWRGTIVDVRSAGRFRSNPSSSYDMVGFRCATNSPSFLPQERGIQLYKK